MAYAKVQNGTILQTGTRPTWRYPQDHEANPGEAITDDSVYRAGGLDPSPDAVGWYPVSDENKPLHDPAREHPPKPQTDSQWMVEADRVVRTWNAPLAKTLDQVKQDKRGAIDQQYAQALRQGASWNGTSWTATDVGRDTLIELHEVAQEENKSVTVLDANGAGHTLSATDLDNLRAAGRVYRQGARENRLALHGQVDAAGSVGDVVAVDETAGWP